MSSRGPPRPMYVHAEQSMLGQPPSADGARRLWGWEHVELWTQCAAPGEGCRVWAVAVTAVTLTALPETESEAEP